MNDDGKKNLERASYVESAFSVGIEPYIKSLEKHGIVHRKTILDVGCGAGQWTFAAARLNPEALVIGADIDDALLGFATKFKMDGKVKNCTFLKESYENLLAHFQPESFEVIMCNSVIQYIDEKKAFWIFSRLLTRKGTLLMFYNHGPGYYLKRSFRGIKNLNRSDAIWGAKTFMVSNIRKRFLSVRSQDHFVTLRYLQKISADVGIILDRIQTEPKLAYSDRFLGFAYVFSCKGTKA